MNTAMNAPLRGLFAFLFLLSLGGLQACTTEEAPEKQPRKEVVVPKPAFRLLLLTQDTPLERALAPSIELGLQQAIAQISSQKDGLGGTELSLSVQRLSHQMPPEEIQALLESADAVFANLDPALSYYVIQATESLPTPFFFVNDGPMRTCAHNEPKRILPTVWQTGLTDSQILEPFLIHLAAQIKVEKQLRFSFFSNDLLWQRKLTSYLKQNVDALGFEVVADQYVDRRIRDFYVSLRRMLRQRADILFLTVAPEYTGALLEQITKMLIYKDFMLATIGLLPEERAEEIGETSNRIRTVSRFVPGFDAAESDGAGAEPDAIWEFEGVSQLRTASAVGAYVSLQLLHKAALKARGVDKTSLNAGLLLVSLSTGRGTVWFDRLNHVLTQPAYGVTVKDGGYENPQYLGDVEHPKRVRCSHSVFYDLEQQEQTEYVPLYD